MKGLVCHPPWSWPSQAEDAQLPDYYNYAISTPSEDFLPATPPNPTFLPPTMDSAHFSTLTFQLCAAKSWVGF